MRQGTPGRRSRREIASCSRITGRNQHTTILDESLDRRALGLTQYALLAHDQSFIVAQRLDQRLAVENAELRMHFRQGGMGAPTAGDDVAVIQSRGCVSGSLAHTDSAESRTAMSRTDAPSRNTASSSPVLWFTSR